MKIQRELVEEGGLVGKLAIQRPLLVASLTPKDDFESWEDVPGMYTSALERLHPGLGFDAHNHSYPRIIERHSKLTEFNDEFPEAVDEFIEEMATLARRSGYYRPLGSIATIPLIEMCINSKRDGTEPVQFVDGLEFGFPIEIELLRHHESHEAIKNGYKRSLTQPTQEDIRSMAPGYFDGRPTNPAVLFVRNAVDVDVGIITPSLQRKPEEESVTLYVKDS